MIVQVLGEGETRQRESRKTLSEGIIEAFDMIGLSCFFANYPMTISRNDFFIRLPKVGIDDGTLSVDSAQRSP